MARPFEETIVIALRTAIMPGLANDQVAGAFVSWLKLNEIEYNHDGIISALEDVGLFFPNLSQMVEEAIAHVRVQRCEAKTKKRQQRAVEQQLLRDDAMER
ncbi:MAG: hypothetical protein A2312_04355 [Candidatus Staskawiczbacteria bacterium RIFOXYB2_FULL_32_9]|uniref:Uncharacterized protein n=1 Tax=Candidatus Staskawiczbacteria bacterium RIFOXYD1_FULL_32_13 TaxID=1802234 RepID=A0A1G2JK51_9BACT|nr:MAG: hypothetical protein UR22_C0009G0016 [Parcubacteria group bacterium GW2011_GWC2_32_10]OGZ78049.1 MAG: hypothetical protein A2360_02755 [Candidatus Staskawiczbacteria bacterium RIFOXYB1_FULL_32_11]OGZ80969.1 MAG: hypothetical protein A2256_00430 [Candidatus Staskawiczbacteria bacterium RIFOXYA2_FULL_32_7]OGZ81856.1 MAG: hypothetical protein A2312_04355 [Candidatus Staskawiczbacteria bacterium RIFOXYB2_FULL_32_9]OGZ85308.1 MAG: hypothetical protein A2463_00785 [Candidatus Staskawiczbacter